MVCSRSALLASTTARSFRRRARRDECRRHIANMGWNRGVVAACCSRNAVDAGRRRRIGARGAVADLIDHTQRVERTLACFGDPSPMICFGACAREFACVICIVRKKGIGSVLRLRWVGAAVCDPFGPAQAVPTSSSPSAVRVFVPAGRGRLHSPNARQGRFGSVVRSVSGTRRHLESATRVRRKPRARTTRATRRRVVDSSST